MFFEKNYNISEKMVEEIFMTIINYSCEMEDKLLRSYNIDKELSL